MPAPDPYDRKRQTEATRSREQSAAGREIGPLPAVADPGRRARALASPRAWCETYFAPRFYLPFAAAPLLVMGRMGRCTEAGGRFACAEPRGGGKTTRAECEVMRAVCSGKRRFVVLIQATEKHAARSLRKIQRELETNDLLAADFPEVCYPVRMLERIHNRARGQTLNGEPTRIEWTADGVTLPAVKGSPASGSIVCTAGLTGALRGLTAPSPTGEILRPDMVILDDVQTRDSAKSPTQTADREAIVTDDVMGLAGPGVEIAALMLCTVIYPGDLSDRFLDPDRHPEWQGVRTRMLESFPADMEWWDRYAEVRRESFRSGDEGRRATELYAAEQATADAGAAVSWPERMKKGELSGIQSAMNLYLDNPRGFKAEYQNEPDPAGGPATAKELHPAAVAGRLSGLPRYAVPREATRLVAFVDVGGGLHWYGVAALDPAFGGAVVDYGCWPRQARAVFAASDPRPSLAQAYATEGRVPSESEAVYAGLAAVVNELAGRVYYREATGEEMRVERVLIDCGWQSATVYRFARESPHAGTIYPSKGIGRTTTARGVSEWKPRPGERSGFHWRLTLSESGRGRMIQFDPDAWKSFLYERLTTAPGGRGGLTFYGRDATAHELIGQHAAAESAEPVTIRGATFDKWTVRPDRPDNHLLDVLTGLCLAGSVQGLVWSPSGAADSGPPAPRPKVKLSEKYGHKLSRW